MGEYCRSGTEVECLLVLPVSRNGLFDRRAYVSLGKNQAYESPGGSSCCSGDGLLCLQFFKRSWRGCDFPGRADYPELDWSPAGFVFSSDLGEE